MLIHFACETRLSLTRHHIRYTFNNLPFLQNNHFIWDEGMDARENGWLGS
jgi:hypothetical protein